MAAGTIIAGCRPTEQGYPRLFDPDLVDPDVIDPNWLIARGWFDVVRLAQRVELADQELPYLQVVRDVDGS